MDAVISTKGQIVIPKRLRDQWGLITGSRVKIASTPAGIQISPVAARTALKASSGAATPSFARSRRPDSRWAIRASARCRPFPWP